MNHDAIIIHGAAVVAAGIAGGLAQLPGSDAPALMGVQTAMVLALAERHGVRIQRAALVDLVLTQSATMAGRRLAALSLRLVPGIGNAANAATAAALTETIGWTAVRLFREREEAEYGDTR